MKRIVIIDYGLGNLRSVQKGLEHVGASPAISGNPEEILAADGIILPGVGAFIDAMKCLIPLKGIIAEFADSGKPMLGICLGQSGFNEFLRRRQADQRARSHSRAGFSAFQNLN